MSVYKPKTSPHYHFDFWFEGNRYHGSTGVTAKRDAQAFERDKRREVALGTKVKPSITMDEAVGFYWQTKGKFEKSSPEGQLGRLSAAFGPTKAIGDLTDLDFIQYVAKRRGQTARHSEALVSNATVNREVELCRRVFRLLAKGYAVPDIEWSKILLPEPKGRVRELGDDEEARLIEALDADMLAVVQFAIMSGQRKTAIITLTWSNVDFGRGVAKVHTKGDVWHEFPLTPAMVALIASQPKVTAQVFTYECQRPAPRKGDAPARVKGERYPFSKDGWRRRWGRALKVAGVADFRFHDLRHTTGSRVTRASGITVTQKLLGHTNIQTTARYSHVLDADLRKAMESAQNAGQSRNSPDENTVVPIKPKKAGR